METSKYPSSELSRILLTFNSRTGNIQMIAFIPGLREFCIGSCRQMSIEFHWMNSVNGTGSHHNTAISERNHTWFEWDLDNVFDGNPEIICMLAKFNIGNSYFGSYLLMITNDIRAFWETTRMPTFFVKLKYFDL